MLKFHPLRVSAVQPEADDAICVTLDVPEELRDQYRAQAGQHVVVRTLVNGTELRRTYSLLNAAGELPLRIAVRTHPKGQLSRHIASSLRKGDTLDVMPPNGSFGPRAEEPGGMFVAFAAGCGITPILSMIRTLLASDPKCRVLLFYGNRNYARGMLLEELLALKDRYLDRFALHFVMSQEPQEIDLLNGRLDAAKVRTFATHLFDPKQVRDYFVCGPGTMIDDVSQALIELGVAHARIHSEHFTNVGVSAASTAANDANFAGQAVSTAAPAEEREAVPVGAEAAEGVTTVNVVMDGRRRAFTMRTNDETILDAADRAGIDLPFSCKAGVCSTCRTKLVRGEVALEQNYALEDWELEQGFILACQAHAKTSELELNYDET